MTAVDLTDTLTQFASHWDHHVVADYNDIMVAGFRGAFPFNTHDTTDDFVLALEGETVMEFQDRPDQTVCAGEAIVVPRGVVHRPGANEEVTVVLLEPKGEPNTGDADRLPAAKPRI